MNNYKGVLYVVFAFSIIALLLIQSIIISFNIYDLLYLFCVIGFLIRFIIMKKDILFKK